MLILGKEEKKLGISRKVYDLIYELNHICPTVLLAVVPQLEFKVGQPLRTAGPGVQREGKGSRGRVLVTAARHLMCVMCGCGLRWLRSGWFQLQG